MILFHWAVESAWTSNRYNIRDVRLWLIQLGLLQIAIGNKQAALAMGQTFKYMYHVDEMPSRARVEALLLGHEICKHSLGMELNVFRDGFEVKE